MRDQSDCVTICDRCEYVNDRLLAAASRWRTFAGGQYNDFGRPRPAGQVIPGEPFQILFSPSIGGRLMEQSCS